MPLPTSSLAKICNVVRGHVETLGQNTQPSDWDVAVTVGAPGANLAASNSRNTLNLFFYRFEPFGFDAAALPGDVQWIKMFCVITSFGVDEDVDDDNVVDFSAGFNELRMLSQVMRLFQETPVMMIEGDDPDEIWHTQFIPRPLEDEQINQIWSTQGDTIYRPSVVYEIALAPVEPQKLSSQAVHVASIGSFADASMKKRHDPWPPGRETRYPDVPSYSIDTANPQWAPAIIMVTGDAGNRQPALSLNFETPVGGGGIADFGSFPEIDIWIAGDTSQSGDLRLVGQLLQKPPADQNGGQWQEIDTVGLLSADTQIIDVENLPEPVPDPGSTAFQLKLQHWTGIDNTSHSWQLQLFAERFIHLDPVTGLWVNVPATSTVGIRIRSNPLLVTLTRVAP